MDGMTDPHQFEHELISAVESGEATPESVAIASRALADQWLQRYDDLVARKSTEDLLRVWFNTGEAKEKAEYWETRAAEGLAAADDLAVNRLKSSLLAAELHQALSTGDYATANERAAELGAMWNLHLPRRFG